MNKQQLANKIWESANKMRSKIEANEYKDYILGFIFYKFLSDKEVDFLKKDGYEEADLQEHVHENNEELVDYCQQHLGYFIAYDNLFSTWLDKGNSFTVDNVRTALSAFNRLISDTQKKVFSKIFNTLETGLSKLGDSTSNQTKAIRDLIQLIKDIPTDGRQDYDVLGFIYEYLISNFAANAGKKAGEFYTPHEVSQLMTSAKNDQIHRFATAIGVDETILRSFMQSKITEANINEFGKFDTLKATVDTEKAKTFLEMIEGKPIKKFQINMKIDQMLRRFILEGGFDIT